MFSRDSEVPVAPDGHKWKEVRHDPMVRDLVNTVVCTEP